jgi:hypothetical protein
VATTHISNNWTTNYNLLQDLYPGVEDPLGRGRAAALPLFLPKMSSLSMHRQDREHIEFIQVCSMVSSYVPACLEKKGDGKRWAAYRASLSLVR